MAILKNESSHVEVIKNENLGLVQRLEALQVITAPDDSF
jgi:hypothetical protein